MRTRALRPVAFALILLVAGGAHAQPAPDIRSQLPPAAQRAWDQGKDLAGNNDPKGALVAFKQAYDISKNPRVLYNVGVLEKSRNNYARAVEAWERELREGATALSPSEFAEVKNAIAVVQPYVGSIDVTANEAGATLFIDDEEVGKTPFAAPVRIGTGKRVVRLSKDGFKDVTKNVEIAPGSSTPLAFKSGTPRD
jgi:hypothetical protein